MLTVLRSVHDRARHQAAMALRAKVGGPEAATRARRIWGSPGQRRFTPADPIWRVHSDATMFMAGIRALLLQSLHPVAMAGVAQNSTYRDDPWGRLQQISNFISVTTFGSIDDAERLMSRVRRVHDTISGTAPNGRAYVASDPDLLTWVHLAEIDSFLDVHQRLAPQPLTAAEADTYVAQTGHAARGIGVPRPPESVADLRADLASYADVLQATPQALDVLDFLRRPSALEPSARAGYSALYYGAIATLPPQAREHFGIRWGSVRQRSALLAGSTGVRALRWVLSDPIVEDDHRTHDQLN